MLEFLIASIIAGKVEIAPNTFQYDIINDNAQVIRVVETETNEITTH